MYAHSIGISMCTTLWRWVSLLLILGSALLLSACSSTPSIADYANQKPPLDLKQYFNGKLIGHGMVQDRAGKVTRRFVVTIQGTVTGDTIVLDEDFVWSDGEKQKRVWTLKANTDGTWRGTASDVVGEARGLVAGNALNWTYTFALPYDGKTIHVQFDDWMYLIDDKVMLNRAVMSKFGFKLAEILISFEKQ